MLHLMTEPERFYVVSMKTPAHSEIVYIECKQSKLPDAGPAVWRITKTAAKAHDFGSLALAREFQRLFKEHGEAYGLKNDGHTWRISDHV
jgi:hypothetical protein